VPPLKTYGALGITLTANSCRTTLRSTRNRLRSIRNVLRSIRHAEIYQTHAETVPSTRHGGLLRQADLHRRLRRPTCRHRRCPCEVGGGVLHVSSEASDARIHDRRRYTVEHVHVDIGVDEVECSASGCHVLSNTLARSPRSHMSRTQFSATSHWICQQTEAYTHDHHIPSQY